MGWGKECGRVKADCEEEVGSILESRNYLQTYLDFFLISQSWTFLDVLLGAMRCQRSN